MLSIKDLIARLPVPGLKESYDRHQVGKVLGDVCGVPVEAKNITIKDSILTLRVPPVLKSAIHVHKEEILAALKREDISVADIR